MSQEKFSSIWDAIADTPDASANLHVRAELMMALKNHLTRSGLTQIEAAKVFGVTQPRISDLLRGKINLFSIDTLVNMAAAAGMRVALQLELAA
ncbi:helix-turn-helix domain-containing protein [Janthinobacterium sp. Mn2066]|uniref:helix-turn-helix domain-containing protein n=1 Tax=Janthinobacterium sp. Mn2066 TaxID=3395264 RepID=UPI003BC6180A